MANGQNKWALRAVLSLRALSVTWVDGDGHRATTKASAR